MNLKQFLNTPFKFKRNTAYRAMLQNGIVVAYSTRNISHSSHSATTITEMYDDTDIDILYMSTTAHISIKDIARNHRTTNIIDGRTIHG